MVCVALAIGGTGCRKDNAAILLTKAATVAPKGIGEYFPIKVGGKTVRMQLAVREDEMQRGLMERRDLGKDDGMIFIYAKPQRLSFWMRNSPTVCGPRSIIIVSSATDCAGMTNTRARFCA